MINYSSGKLKVLTIVLALLLYVYFLFFIKTLYLKSKRLDHLTDMASDTHKKMLEVHSIDQNLAFKIAQLENVYANF